MRVQTFYPHYLNIYKNIIQKYNIKLQKNNGSEQSKMEYCDNCGAKFKIIYKTNVYCLKHDISTGETIWTWFRRISKNIWVERYQKFVKNLNEEHKKKFNQKIKLLFDKYFICSNCGKEIQDRYWSNKEGIRKTSLRRF